MNTLDHEKRIFIDESGYTGENLLDDVQPFFVVSSLRCSAEEAEGFRAKYFGRVQASELKSRNILKNYPDRCDEFFNEISRLNRESARVVNYYWDKRFALLAKSIDWLVEPILEQQGINLYEDGMNMIMTTSIWFDLLAGDMLDEVLRCLHRSFEHNNIGGIKSALEIIEPIVSEEGALKMYYNTLQDPGVQNLIENVPVNGNDLALASLVQIMHEWRQRYPDGKLSVEHDESSNLAPWIPELRKILSADVPSFRADTIGRKISFPIDATFELVSSSNSVGVQLADLIAGGIRRNWASTTELLDTTIFYGPMSSEALSQLKGTDQNESLNHMIKILMKD